MEVDDPEATVEFRDTDVASPEAPVDVAIATDPVVGFALPLPLPLPFPDPAVGTTIGDVAIAAVPVVDFTFPLPDDAVAKLPITFEDVAEDATGDAAEVADALAAAEVMTPDP